MNFVKGTYFVNLITSALISFQLIFDGWLSPKLRWAIVGIIVAIQIVFGLLIFSKRRNKDVGKRVSAEHGKVFKITISSFMILLIAITGIGSYYIFQGSATLNKLSKGEEVLAYSIIVRKDSDKKNMKDVYGNEVMTSLRQDRANIKLFEKAFKESKKTKGKELKLKDCGSYMEGAKDLLKDNKKIFLMNEAYRQSVEDFEPEFAHNTRVIKTFKINKGKMKAKKSLAKGESFNIYLSGIDTYGDVSKISRTDTNLILSVNPKTQKVLIVTIPRDTYLQIAGGGNNQYDKLTHSGIYGVESSVETLENFLDIDIDYYARVNFTSFVQIVDILGGIDVYNDEAFYQKGLYFPEGKIHLDGEKALAFARERHALSDGDFARGRNQEKIIAAIIDKAQGPKILLHYKRSLDVIFKSMDTNMPKKQIISLINMKMGSKGSWTTESIEVKGKGEMNKPSYAMPGYRLYMMIPYEDSVKQVKSALKNNINNRQND